MNHRRENAKDSELPFEISWLSLPGTPQIRSQPVFRRMASGVHLASRFAITEREIRDMATTTLSTPADSLSVVTCRDIEIQLIK
ncbi:MAG TPA: hypothetical protein VG273_09500 [Bryobacteraceae bacterium]|nr:hypothetical protein [Bryobacteraceae bacterium]